MGADFQQLLAIAYDEFSFFGLLVSVVIYSSTCQRFVAHLLLVLILCATECMLDLSAWHRYHWDCRAGDGRLERSAQR